MIWVKPNFQPMKDTRRQFLFRTAPLIVASSTLGLGRSVAANSRVNLATIGLGGRGFRVHQELGKDERVQIVAVCDVDANHRERARAHAKLDPKAAYNDFREVVNRDDIDAVMIGTPDHWHSHIAVAAAKAGKDIYCEKPMTSSIGEGRILSDVVRCEKRVLQCGTQRRSMSGTRRACELVRNGYLGQLKHVEVGVRGKFAIRGGYTGKEPPKPVPPELDYELWQGPAPRFDYTPGRVHFNFRWVNEYAPGYITDWGVHFVDVVQWALGMDESCPVEVTVRDQKRRAEGIYNAAESFDIHYRYANGVTMRMFSTEDRSQWGVKFVGSEGWLYSEGQRLNAEKSSVLDKKLNGSDTRLYVSENHYRNFIDSVYFRKVPVVSAETGHRSATACYIGAIAAEVGGTLKFDPKKEKFTNSDAANQQLMRKMHGGWKLG